MLLKEEELRALIRVKFDSVMNVFSLFAGLAIFVRKTSAALEIPIIYNTPLLGVQRGGNIKIPTIYPN